MAGKVDISKLAEKLNKLNENTSSNQGGMNFLNINDGRNVIRVLPPKSENEDFYKEVWVHYGIGKTDQNKKGTMVVCPTTDGENEACPVCELSKQFFELSSEKDDSYSKQAKSFYRKKRVYYNAISRDEDLSVYTKEGEGDDAKWVNSKTGDEESPIKVLGTGVGIFKDILGLIIDPEYGDVTDFEEGLDLIITKSGSGQFNTKYDVKTVRKETPAIPDDAPQEIQDEWEDMLNDLSPLAKPKSYDTLLNLLNGKEEDEDNNEDNEGKDEPESKEDDSSDTSSEENEQDINDEIQKALANRKKK